MNEFPTQTAETALKTAEGIANYGALVVITSFAIILCTFMIVYFFVGHRRMTRSIERQNETNNRNLALTLKRLENYLGPVSENARLNTMTAIQAIAHSNFKLCIENVLQIIERIQEENNISNEAATRRKLRMFVSNIHNDRKLYFSNFTFSGHTVDYYTDSKWIDIIVDTAFSEIYSKNKKRARTNIKAAYESIFIEFKNNLLVK